MAINILQQVGIYQILNINTGKRYIGQSFEISKRKAHHYGRLRCGKHACRTLQRSFLKHGIEAFAFSVIEYCLVSALTEREQYWMDFYKSTGIYNECPAAGTTRGSKRSAETCKRISDSNMGKPKHNAESRERIGASQRGKKRGPRTFTDEWRANMSKARIGLTLSPAHKEKISQSLIGNTHTKGSSLSDEHKLKIAVSMTGKKFGPSPLRGTTHSAETIAKRSASLTGKKASIETRKKLSDAQLNRDPLINKNLSTVMKEKWKNPEYRNMILASRKQNISN